MAPRPQSSFGNRFRSLDRSLVFPTLSAVVLGLMSVPADAEYYEFTLIADDAGQFSSFMSQSVNTERTVVFHALLDSGEQGVYTSSDGAITEIADSTGLFSHFVRPRLNSNGTVVFWARLDTGVEGLYTSSAGTMSTVADTTSGAFDSYSNPTINDAGTIAFHAATPVNPTRTDGIYKIHDGIVTAVADTAGSISYFPNRLPFINSTGDVAFLAQVDSSGDVIFRGNGGELTTVADTSDSFDSFRSELGINSTGNVAFHGDMDAGGIGIFTGSGGSVTRVVERNDNGPFVEVYSSLSLNDGNVVLFKALRADPPCSPVEWTLQGVEFEDGGAATGSFTYDADLYPSKAYSNMSIATTATEAYPAATFSVITGGGATGFNALEDGIADYTGHPMLILLFADALTNDGGTVDLAVSQGVVIRSRMVTCLNADCSEVSSIDPPYRDVVRGTVYALLPSPPSDCGHGIFVGDDPVSDKVIKKGDLLDGKIVIDAQLTHYQGINNNGDIVFRADFLDGSQALYLARVVERPLGRFDDVPLDHWAFSFIETLALSGITGGCGDGNYCPDSPVTRDQMAVFLERGINGADFVPPPATGAVFGDVSANDFAAAFIEQLFVDGITGGCGYGDYCPSLPVTRAQMAVFLLRAKYGSGYLPPAPIGIFTDVPLGSFADAYIEQLAAEGITGGCGDGNYCPNDPVSRAQMAVFLVRTFGF